MIESRPEMVIIRRESPEQIAAIRHVLEMAFGRPSEADLVDALRENGKIVLSLVAEDAGQVVGQILFSPVTIETERDVMEITGLAPLSVLPQLQNRGIGSLLVREGLEQCRAIGRDCVVVLGHPTYYPRFGFVPASRYGVKCEYNVPDEVFMITGLQEEPTTNCAGIAKYQPEFNQV